LPSSQKNFSPINIRLHTQKEGSQNNRDKFEGKSGKENKTKVILTYSLSHTHTIQKKTLNPLYPYRPPARQQAQKKNKKLAKDDHRSPPQP